MDIALNRLSRRRLLFLIMLMLLLSAFSAVELCAQAPTTKACGVVVDAKTGEPVMFANIFFAGTQIGTISDVNGHFEISNDKGYSSLVFQYLSYKTTIVNLKPNRDNELRVEMQAEEFMLNTIVVTPGKKEKYSKKNNPAVDLVRNVIQHKHDNRPVGEEEYKLSAYEKLVMSLDKFDFDLDSSRFWRNFSFIEDYLDTSMLNNTPVLTVSLRETIYDEYYRRSSHDTKKVVHLKNMQGVDKVLDREGLGANLESMLQSMDIFSDNMEILLNSFVSPLSSSLATAYYKYFILDTVQISGHTCVDLGFIPMNSESFGFTGHLYVDTDGSYALRKYSLNVPAKINLNFVSNLSVEQEYSELSNGILVPTKADTYVNFFLFKNMRQIYAHQTKIVDNYDFDVPDEEMEWAMDIQGDVLTMPDANRIPKQQWVEMRPIPLSPKEALMDSLVVELERVPRFRNVVKTAEVLVSGYIPTSKQRTQSRFDFGPVYSFASWNSLEGIRLRVGGMTTANLNENWFANGYLAFGTRDLRLKYNVTGIYSFAKKDYHAYESFRNAFYVSSRYDVEVPGQMYEIFERDNIFMSLNVGMPLVNMQYVAENKIMYEKEWPNRVSIKTWIAHENNEAAGALRYMRYEDDDVLMPVSAFNDLKYGFTFRFAPGEPLFNNRMGRSSLFNLSNDAPVFSFSHVIGYIFEERCLYNTTEFKAQKRFWLSSFGHIDLTLDAGIQWNKVPFPRLFIPMTNQSLFLQPTAFNMMRPMEFLTDQYVSLHATYYLKGWILNRIPIIKKAKLREVVSFSALYGSLSAKNNPMLSPEGLYEFPEGAGVIGRYPYMEMSVGVENIFKFIRVDYVRRLNYLDAPNVKKNGVRLSFRFTF